MCHHSVCYDVNMSYCDVYVQYVCSLYYLATCIVVFSHANIKKIDYCKWYKIRWAKLWHFSQFTKIPQDLSVNINTSFL